MRSANADTAFCFSASPEKELLQASPGRRPACPGRKRLLSPDERHGTASAEILGAPKRHGPKPNAAWTFRRVFVLEREGGDSIHSVSASPSGTIICGGSGCETRNCAAVLRDTPSSFADTFGSQSLRAPISDQNVAKRIGPERAFIALPRGHRVFQQLQAGCCRLTIGS
jgi:hypothetical protein